MFKIGTAEIGQVIPLTELILKVLVALPTNTDPKKQGGYLTIRHRDSALIWFLSRIGNFPFGQAERYLRLSREKGRRLITNVKDITSFQSRDPESDKWGGAINASEFTFSVSGLSELGDEALMIELAIQLNLINFDDATKMAAISDNQLFYDLHKAAQGC